jgi:hypothetical protein
MGVKGQLLHELKTIDKLIFWQVCCPGKQTVEVEEDIAYPRFVLGLGQGLKHLVSNHEVLHALVFTLERSRYCYHRSDKRLPHDRVLPKVVTSRTEL